MKNLPLGAAACACCAAAALGLEPAGPPTVDEGPPEAWWQRETLTGGWLGWREALESRGLSVFGGWTSDVWGNLSGGLKTGAVYTGLLDFGVEVDLESLVGWRGARASTTWLWLSGRDASEELVGNFLTISNIAGFNTLRMIELWLEQNFLDGKISLRAGQLAADSEFAVSETALLFLNGTFGWPAFAYLNIPAGGPGYPMGAPGVRLALHPADCLTFQSAIFQGYVYDQNVNRHGFRWRLDGANGLTFLNELGVRWPGGGGASGLPGAFKSGMWIQTGQRADVLASSTGSGNYGWYFVLDQMLWREAGSKMGQPNGCKGSPGGAAKTFQQPLQAEDCPQGLSCFSRLAFADPFRNFISFYLDAGLVYRGLIPGRDHDLLGVAFACAHTGSGAISQLREEGALPSGAEMAVEWTYQARITPWLSLQPDLQLIIFPGASRTPSSAWMLGGRVAVNF